MKVVVAIDSFKGSLSSLAAGNAVKEAVLKADDKAEVVVKALADGGEGTVSAFLETENAEAVTLPVTGPLGAPVTATYCILKDKDLAVVEMAEAAGITLVPTEMRNPLNTTTYGVGEMIKDAIEKGCRRFIIGIGGSATNDGGTGMLSALGYEFLDESGNPVPLGAKGLESLKEIKCDKILPQLSECSFSVACDVANPLCGESGCSAVYGPQKGATAEMIEKMDGWLKNFALLTKEKFPNSDANHPGSGAAGGLGFAFLSFTNSTLKSGVDIIISETELEKHIKDADIVVTGEGRLDSQTVMGKAPIGVAKLAKKYNKRVIAFSGCVTEDAEILNDNGIDAFFPILRGVTTLDEALQTEAAYKNLTATAYQVFRLIADA